MVYAITLKVRCECDGLDMWDDKDCEVNISEDLEDVIAYLFYKKYGKYYNELSWFLEPGAREFVKEIEDSWNANTFDTFSLYHDPEFLKFIHDVIYDDYELTEEQLEEILEDFKEDVKDELDGMSKADIQYLIADWGPNLEFWAGSLRDEIDLEEYLENNYWKWDDEEEEDD